MWTSLAEITHLCTMLFVLLDTNEPWQRRIVEYSARGAR